MPSPKPVRISKTTGLIVPVDRLVKLRKGETVVWVAQDGGGPWRITFSGATPFSQSVYIVPPGGSVNSGPAIGDEDETYTYEVSPAPTGPQTDVGVVKVVKSMADVDVLVEEAIAKTVRLASGQTV